MRALRELVRDAQQGDLAVTPDGPRGPFLSVKQGLPFLAARTGSAVIAASWDADRRLQLPSWDRFRLPLPGAKVVVFESTDDAAFDMRMTCSLFPDFEQQVNAISAGDKRRVADLYELLEKARKAGHVHARFYAITDADDDDPIDGPETRFRWDVYHIEQPRRAPTS